MLLKYLDNGTLKYKEIRTVIFINNMITYFVADSKHCFALEGVNAYVENMLDSCCAIDTTDIENDLKITNEHELRIKAIEQIAKAFREYYPDYEVTSLTASVIQWSIKESYEEISSVYNPHDYAQKLSYLTHDARFIPVVRDTIWFKLFT